MTGLPSHRLAPLGVVASWWRDPRWAWPRTIAGLAAAAVLAGWVLR